MLKSPPGLTRMNMFGRSAALGFTEATSNVDCAADDWLRSPQAINNQRVQKAIGLMN